MATLLNPTIRLLRYGQLYNERTNCFIRLSDAQRSPDLQRELNREEEYIYTLKYRPTAVQLDQPIEKFARACLSDLSASPDTAEMKPHLECTSVEETEGEVEIPEINRKNFAEVLGQNKISIVAVFARRC